MAKFNAFDEHCDASAMLTLLAKVPVFSHAVQSAAGVVKQARNAWAHCVFRRWDLLNFRQCFADMEKLVKALELPSADETDLLKELNWEMKGAILCMNVTIDPDLVKTVQQDVSALKNDVDKLAFEEEVNRENLKKALQNAVTDLEELQKRVAVVEHEQEVIKEEQEFIKEDQSSLCEKMQTTQGQIRELKSEQQDLQQHVNDLKEYLNTRVSTVEHEQEFIKEGQSYLCEKVQTSQGQISKLKSEQEDVKHRVHNLGMYLDTRVSTLEQEQEIIKQDHSSLCGKVSTTQGQLIALQSGQEDVQRRVTCLEDQQNRSKAQISYDIASCDAEISFFAGRHDKDTRQWLLEDFDKWFNDPGDSRAYVLLGDPGVGKSVIAGVLAHRSKKAGSLGAAYFCRHNDGTRNDPRCLLGTVACQLCECNSEYTSIVEGEDGVRNLLGNYKLGVQELFTKLLQEPLGKCNLSQQRKLVVIDALDETQYESREDFLDLIMNRFPILPKWLVFFINTVQLRLKKYNPCVRICAGNVEHHNFFQQHDQDIKLFLRKNVDVSGLPFPVDDVANKCKGSFLYAFYIAKDLNVKMQSGKSFQLGDLFPGDFDTYLLKNFKRVFAKVGSGLFKKLFGCAIVAPAPLPVSFISYVLQRENSIIDKKLVVDALSLFMVLRKTFTFLHNLIPAWLTDEDKAEELFINMNIEAKYLKDIIFEILVSFIHEESQNVAHIKTDLLDYVLRFGIRFLCGLPGKNSLETVFTCLTSFKYIQNRIQSRRIEIYSLIEDFKLAADCPVLGDGKKDVLLEVSSALESNIFVLLECPHLLYSCLQNASEAVQKSIVIPCHTSTSRLQWNSWALPAAERGSGMWCYAVSPDGKLLAARVVDSFTKGSVVFYDSFSMKVVLGPVELPWHTNHLEFSPDGKFLFYGRLDKWFSLERECVEEFPQFSLKNDIYEWGSFTLDEQCIVVKKRFYRTFHRESAVICCKLCMLNCLCLWAAAEIGQGQESEAICGCFPDRLSVESLLSEAQAQDSPVPAMRSLLNVLKSRKHDEWCCLLKKLQLNYTFELIPPECSYCSSRKNHDTLKVASVHEFIINHYSMIFKYQVWNMQIGRSVLDQALSSGIQMSTFSYLCHLANALELCGVLFSDIDKSLSICNIALLNTVYHHLIFFNAYRKNCLWREFELFERREQLEQLEQLEPLDQRDLEWLERAQLEDHEQLEHLKWLERQQRTKHHEQRLERVKEIDCREDERYELHEKLEHERLKHHEWLERLERCRQRKQLTCERLERLVQFVHLLWYRLEPSKKFKSLEVFHYDTNIFTNAPSELQTLSDARKKGGFLNMLPCVSPDGKWIAMRPDDKEKVVHLHRGENRERQHTHVDSRNAVHAIKEVEHYAFTNDSVFFLYLTMRNSLFALSLRTGNILTSVSGVRPLFLIPEKQTGYLFRVHDEDNIILVKDFPSGFLKCFFIPVVKKPIQVAFAPADTILVLRSDSVLTVMKAEAEGDAFTIVSGKRLKRPGGKYQKVTKCQFSQDGKLIVTHQGTNILLYYTSSGSTYHSVYAIEDKSYAVNFAFSVDSSFLLFWILQRNNRQYFHVWDVQKKVISASFDSSGLLSGDCCCCFASGNKELIICNDFHIEIWDHTSPPCRLLKSVGIDVPYTEVDTFSYCTVSQENDVLACCIADKILIYPLSKAADQSIFQLPRAHLGKIEMCQFLKGNHYLISYGVDGMVFLWDLSECKAIAYAKIAQGRESIVSMAVSPEEDKAVCLTSFWRLNIIKLCGLKCTTLSKLPLPKAMTSSKVTQAFQRQEKPTATIQSPACSANTDISMDLDVAELIEEMDFMLGSDVSEESDEQSDELDELQD